MLEYEPSAAGNVGNSYPRARRAHADGGVEVDVAENAIEVPVEDVESGGELSVREFCGGVLALGAYRFAAALSRSSM